MDPLKALGEFFRRSRELAAVYLYGRYAEPPTYPDSDIEVALLFRPEVAEEDIREYLEHLAEENPLGPTDGVLMPTVLNGHILPVQYEQIRFGQVLLENAPDLRQRFEAEVEARMRAERARHLEEAREILQQARAMGEGIPAFSIPPGRTLRLVDPIRVGWRLGRVLTSCAVIEVSTRDIEQTAKDPEQVAQVVGWFSNAVGAATGIAKAMLTTYEEPRPPRRWQVFLPLADLGILPMEQALWMAALVESRWRLVTAGSVDRPERTLGTLRASLPALLHFARVSAWATDLVEEGEGSRIH
ncbi:MAG: nucleotidyltransferase domain-containing protein [Armatimonadetes bacterium]|nr:nucleotidyltransferase domain-containing protein [Armatimonadota bacterium]MDW8154238.1 nucleotidyltransferase domain-containing protein [Armatimonadota bacterium]